jgi:predicted dehydrogenase
LRAALRLPGVEVSGILDRDPSRARALAERLGLPPAIAEPRRFYEAQPRLVHVTTPPASHYDIAMEAFARGIHVLVEKPPALTVEACAALQRAAEAHGVTIGVDENTAFDPLIREARELIARGSLGCVLHIGGYFSFGMPPKAAPPGWMEELPGGMLEDLLPHLVTTARSLSGSPLVVRSWHFARSGLLAGEHDDLLSLALTGNEGLVADLTLSLVAQPPQFTIVIHGSEASLALDLRNMLMRVSRAGIEGSAIGRGRDILSANFGAVAQTAWNTLNLLRGRRERFGSPLGLIRAHYAAIEAGTEVPAPLSRAVETVAVARAIWPALADDAVDRPSSLVTPVGNAAS